MGKRLKYCGSALCFTAKRRRIPDGWGLWRAPAARPKLQRHVNGHLFIMTELQSHVNAASAFLLSMHLSESTLASEPSQRQSLIVAAAHAAWRLLPSSCFDVCAARAAFRLHAAAATSEVSERLSQAIGSRGMCPAFAQQHTHSLESAVASEVRIMAAGGASRASMLTDVRGHRRSAFSLRELVVCCSNLSRDRL